MYTLNIANTIKKMSVNGLRDFIFEKYYKQIGFVKERSYCLMERLKEKFIVACKQINRKNT